MDEEDTHTQSINNENSSALCSLVSKSETRKNILYDWREHTSAFVRAATNEAATCARWRSSWRIDLCNPLPVLLLASSGVAPHHPHNHQPQQINKRTSSAMMCTTI